MADEAEETGAESRVTAGAVLARSMLQNVAGQTLPLLIGLVLTPFIIGRLGSDGFGVLSLGWTVLTLSSVFNIGLGRATTKFAAEHLVSGEVTELASLFWISVVLNIALGLAGAALVAWTSVSLIGFGVLKVPPALAVDAQSMLVVIAFALPFTFVTTTLRGMLEAGQHFAAINWARLVFNTAVFVLPAVTLAFSPRLTPIAWLLTLSRVAEMVVSFWLCLRSFPFLRRLTIATSHLRKLLVYGGWLTVTNVLMPLIVNMDRFAIGSLLSIRAVAYYSVPTDLVIRLTTLPSSIVAPLFPAFSALGRQNDRARLSLLYARSMKYVALSMAGVVGLVIAFASPFLSLWLGAEFAQNSTAVMQIMSVAILVNSITYLPYTVLQAVGRPDVTAKCHLFETPIAVPLMWLLTKQYGVAGTAVAWGLRVALDLGLLAYATLRLRYLSGSVLSATRCGQAAVWSVGFVTVAYAMSFIDSLPLRAVLVLIVTSGWAVAVVWFVLDEVEHRWLLMLPRRAGWVAV